MNTINQTIPTAFSPDTAFAITLADSSQPTPVASEVSRSFRFTGPAAEELEFRGIPESALHD